MATAQTEGQVYDVLVSNLLTIARAVASKEARLLFGRVLRTTASIRSSFSDVVIRRFVLSALPQSSNKTLILDHLESGDVCMESNGSQAAETAKPRPSLPEEEMYCLFVLCQYLCDLKEWSKLQTVSEAAIEQARTHNRRTLDVLASRAAFYLSLAHENLNTLAALRPRLLQLHESAVLNHDKVGQEVLYNLLLRNYLHYNMYDQAEKFRAQAQHAVAPHSNQQLCRYLYYLGRLRAVQLEYSEAKECLQQAARKAPSVAKGFTVCVYKLLTVIRLLLGEIPQRAEFELPGLEGALEPYLCLTAAVRNGDVTTFNSVASKYEKVFQDDRTYNLINRLRYNVLRSGLSRISIAYSRISLQDVAVKLGLESVADTEAVIAKAIRDGSISTTLEHEKQWLVSRKFGDAYVSDEPHRSLHARTAFCMDIHNEAVKAMRFDVVSEPVQTSRNLDQGGIEEAIAAALLDDGDDF